MKTARLFLGVAICVAMLCSVAQAAEKNTFGLKRFDTPQKVRIGYFAGCPMALPFYIADKEGFFKELNIEIVYETFFHGPAIMEANTAWDIASSGTGGFITGTLGYGINVFGISDYTENLALFVRKDSPIVKDPTNPASWKGTTWLYPVGTTVQPVLTSALKKVGLDLNDVKSINMDQASALTAFSGGSGDGVAVWDTIAFTAEDRGFVRVGDARSLKFVSPCALMAKKEYIDANREVVIRVFEVFYKTWEWSKSSEQNMKKAAAYYLENTVDEGLACNESIAKRAVEWFKCPPSIAEAVDAMAKASPDSADLYKKRDLYQAEKDALMAIDYFITQNKYKPADREKFLDNRYVDPSIALEIQKRGTK